ncbi:DUF1501 domain-containing protein [Pseudomarimonas arenosa]|uniref:DUF1501 domain-containing protein n=1 Tax=Pseudomarimonas arenosa TaxID=2774145 RepID=A0AAW3ZP02_9GAMM|nr:DUF1501 domain-containing protein [Pseudomarimonas arenosa]MBD8527913.1 DUF1501 domain-containing protein [Pseudomarimonas arenosa]
MSRNSRRDFLRAGAASLACGGFSTLFPQIGLIPTALAGTPQPGYKALVCLFLSGGNDAWNLLLPGNVAAHGRYVAARNGLHNTSSNLGGLAFPHHSGSGFINGQTLPASLSIAGGQYGLNPFAPELKTLYDQGRLAFVNNMGTLIAPVTRANYNNFRPPQLYSHNDQTRLWQIGSGSSTSVTRGWGGMVAGYTAQIPTLSGLPPTITLSGQNRFLIGTTPSSQSFVPFSLSTSSSTPATQISNYPPPTASQSSNRAEAQRRAALEELLNAASPQAFTNDFRDTLDRSISLAEEVLNPAISAIDTNDPVNTPFAAISSDSLATRLRQIARVIKVSTDNTLANPINANRQVFYVSLGGWDTHSDQINGLNSASGHARLIERVSQAVAAFYQAMVNIGRASDVTLFSASEFGRTLNSNGDGSDHAWGSLQFAVGGAVNGGMYGRYPEIVLNNSLTGTTSVNATQGECFSRGQFLPTTAVDQFAATLARWMGVSNSDLPVLFPNIDNFTLGGHPNANPASTPTFANFSRIIPGMMNGVV